MNVAILLSEMYRDYLAVQAGELIVPNGDLRGLCFFVSPWLDYRFPHLSRAAVGKTGLYGKMRTRQRSLFRQSGLHDVWPFHLKNNTVGNFSNEYERQMIQRTEWVKAHLQSHQCETRLGKALHLLGKLGSKIIRKT